MAEVVVSVNKRQYSVACDDGQEPHLRKLAAALDKRVEQLAEQMGQIGDQRLLLMAGLLLADELYELESQLNRATAALEHDAAGREAAGIAALAERVEALAARVETDAG